MFNSQVPPLDASWAQPPGLLPPASLGLAPHRRCCHHCRHRRLPRAHTVMPAVAAAGPQQAPVAPLLLSGCCCAAYCRCTVGAAAAAQLVSRAPAVQGAPAAAADSSESCKCNHLKWVGQRPKLLHDSLVLGTEREPCLALLSKRSDSRHTLRSIPSPILEPLRSAVLLIEKWHRQRLSSTRFL